MNKFNLAIILLSLLMLMGCISQRVNQLKESYSTIPETEKSIDIPTYSKPHQFAGLYYNYWHFCKQKEYQLELEQLESSETDEVFRMWITRPLALKDQFHILVSLQNNNQNITAELYLMKVDFNPMKLTETITSYKRYALQSSFMDLHTMMDSLHNLKIDELPTDEKIEGYYDDSPGYRNNLHTYSFEYSTPEVYRFYQYNDIFHAPEEFWQAGNVVSILNLLDSNLQIAATIDSHFENPKPQTK